MRMRHRTALSFALISCLLPGVGAFAQPGAPARSECIEPAPFPCSTPEDEGLDPFVIEAFMNDVAWWGEQGRIVGAELLIIKNRRIVWHQAVGWSDRERQIPLERNSIYRIRSMTKPFTGTAILMLAEEGRLDLDDRVVRYLSSFYSERSDAITIRELMTFGAGFEQTRFPDGYWESPDLRSAVDLGEFDGGRLLDEATIREALAPAYSAGYGMHWERFSGPVGDSDLPRFGHEGSDGTIAIAFPEADALVLNFTQSRGARMVWREAIRRIPALVGLE